jgi:hypothetical protein
LPPLAQRLGSVSVTAGKIESSLELNGFYRRWLDGQKGVTSAVFIGPEEIEKRNTSRASALLGGVTGVELYKRGGNMPSDFHVDGECGAIALWTGNPKR